ncbi:hypothetical protein BDP27DRAFT_1543991 [Rhodocollybia butyracea]|uniref:Uncharacterized protein n=1 Tax=Rhodocollybia butyracea TaxID=206335 RepID=A0A9P5U599_9AGAR|nr:hypothetical protein BDP27DRAFT_1543991 [Rhodocollybia butyracea]
MRGVAAAGIPRGGGADAFKSGQARIPSGNDEDYDGMNRPLWFSGKSSTGQERTEKKLRWNIFKSLLFLSNAFFSIYTLTTLIFCLLTWFDVFHHADIIRVGNRTELIFSTLAASFGLFTSIIGWSGILLNNRGFLAVYTFFLWITFAFLVIPGYITYKRQLLELQAVYEYKIAYPVCGWFSPFVEATISQTCYARSVLPGCKLAYLDWQKRTLERWYTIAFGLVPLQITVLVAGLLCSNHVTYRFGKGMIPKRYQLNPSAMKVIVDKYKNEISDRYGNDIASDIIARSPGLQNYSLGLVELDNASQRHSSSPPSARNRGSMVPHNDSFGKFWKRRPQS